MYIQFVWDSSSHPASSSELAGQISMLGIELTPGSHTDWTSRTKQTLGFEAPGLSAQKAAGEFCYARIISEFKNALRACGINAQVLVDGRDLLDYAAQQEAKVVFLKIHSEMAANELKQTRTWLKDGRIAEIRRKLEQAIKDVAMVWKKS